MLGIASLALAMTFSALSLRGANAVSDAAISISATFFTPCWGLLRLRSQ